MLVAAPAGVRFRRHVPGCRRKRMHIPAVTYLGGGARQVPSSGPTPGRPRMVYSGLSLRTALCRPTPPGQECSKGKRPLTGVRRFFYAVGGNRWGERSIPCWAIHCQQPDLCRFPCLNPCCIRVGHGSVQDGHGCVLLCYDSVRVCHGSVRGLCCYSVTKPGVYRGNCGGKRMSHGVIRMGSGVNRGDCGV